MNPAHTPNTGPTPASWVMILFLGLAWGGAFPMIEIALQGITPFWLASYRIGFATLLSLAVWAALGWKLFDRPLVGRERVNLVAVGLMSSAVPFMLISWGQQYVTAGFTGVAMACVALIVLPLAHFLIPGERITPRKILGFFIGFAGILVLMGPDAFVNNGQRLELAGQLTCLAAAGCYAVSSILIRRLPAVDPIGLSTVLLLIGVVAVIPAALLKEGAPPPVDGPTLFALAVLGLIPTAAANLLRVQVIRTAGPVFMSLTNYQVPVWAVLIGVIFLGEPLHMSLLVATVLILIGVALSQWSALSQLMRRKPG
ncbi:DMT family transporter [Chachezhania sediminis]|uniref:DMT family transporter n=1 Tax=Chachezhania sediminis TaxID=2599291 RepID=UPI001E553D18|nr:DMT family transporter [Chachezhania sediminis]